MDHTKPKSCFLLQAEYVRVPMADSTLIPTPDNVTDKEALLVGDVLPTGMPSTTSKSRAFLRIAF